MSKRLLAAAAGALLATAPAAAQTVAIVGGTVETMAGPAIPNGTVLIRDGRIVAVGANVAVPAGARTIDARGKTVTPGFFDSSTQIGLEEVGAVDETNDHRLNKDPDHVAAAFDVRDGLNPNSIVIPVTRIAGVTTAVSRPDGGLISGQSVVVDLTGMNVDSMLIRGAVAMYASLAEGSRGEAGGSRSGQTMLLRQVLDDARTYARNREAYNRGQFRQLAASRLDLEALQPVLAGRMPLVVEVNRASDIRTTLAIAKEFGIRVVIGGGAEAWMVADELARANVPVVVKVLQDLPETFESLGERYDNAAILRRAGVKVAITAGDTHNARNVKQEAGNAVANGLSHDDALRAITLNPAQIWGVADRLGSLEPGKLANVVVWGGDPLELLTPVEHVLIHGREVPLVSRETMLRDRYLHLNDETRAYPSAAARPTPVQTPQQ
ncbi:MAG TPA: amidohydrolase family protein [Longimicrobiaceae bacterium]|jgi:imidazolonepropionase-like amidohydrolase|nr:amidohydrolase family protein [Longimicrobiaceae bacterium]